MGAITDILAAWPDRPKMQEMFKEIAPYILEQAIFVLMPAPFKYSFWQPWVKGYNGESFIGHGSSAGLEAAYLWLDLDMKRKMGK